MAATIDPGLRLFVRKLERLGPLTDEERRTLEDLPLSVRRVDTDRDLVRDGQRPSHCLLLLEGFSCRYKVLADGGRQITSFHIPGDIVDLTGLLLGRMDHGIGTLTPVRVAPIPQAAILDWMGRHPGLARLLWRDTMVDAAVFREWVVDVGRRSARQRVAHPLCELVTRLRAAGLARDRGCGLPITQAELADATGLSAVPVNRTLQELASRA